MQQEAASSQSLSQLKAAQEAVATLRAQHEQQIADVIGEKDKAAAGAVAAVQSKAAELDAKLAKSQEVRTLHVAVVTLVVVCEWRCYPSARRC